MVITAWEVAVYGLAAALLVGPFAVPWVVRRHDPALAVGLRLRQQWRELIEPRQTAANLDELDFSKRVTPRRRQFAEDPALLDPWGRPWRWSPASMSFNHESYPQKPWIPAAVYSVGPNGVDDRGSADDVMEVVASKHPALRWFPSGVWHTWAPWGAGLLVAAGTACLRRWIVAARRGGPRELITAAIIAVPPAAVGAVWAWSAAGLDAAFADSSARGAVLLPARVVVPVSWALLWFLLALAWRLTRSRIAPADVGEG